MPYDLDAAVTWHGTNYFFKGCIAYEYNSSFPTGSIVRRRKLSDWKMPCDIDAATVWSKYVYFFKGEKVWMWHYDKEELVDGPVSFGTWNIGTSNIDAAVKWFPKGKVYMFKLFTYWRINENADIDIKSAITAGWPGLLESDLFPACACDCTDSPHHTGNWELEKIDFEVESAYTEPLQEFTKHVIDIGNGNPEVQKEFKVFKDFVRIESFNHITGIKLATGTSFKTAVPYSINGKVRITDADTFDFVYGVRKEVPSTILKVFNCPYLTDMKVTCTVAVHMIKLSVPYNMTLRRSREGCKCTSTGRYTKFSFSHMYLSVSQSTKD